MRRHAPTRCAFSLIEIIVVVMILGILGSIAAPKLLGTSQQAVDNGLRQTLGVIRTAIDSYSAETGGKLPGADGAELTFKNEMAKYLRGKEFPTCPVGAAQNNAVRMLAGNGAIAGSIGGTAATHSWVYQYETGEFRVNSDAVCGDGVTTYVEF
jgi:prepilin-type N-terminal cleavage/methylation domain-containing protein